MRAVVTFVSGMLGWTVAVLFLSIMQACRFTEFNLSMEIGSFFTGGRSSAAAWVLGFLAGLLIAGFMAWIYVAVFKALGRGNAALGVLGGIIHGGLAGLILAWFNGFRPGMPDSIGAPGAYGGNYGGLAIVFFFIMHAICGGTVGAMYKRVHIPTEPARPDAMPQEQEHFTGIGGG